MAERWEYNSVSTQRRYFHDMMAEQGRAGWEAYQVEFFSNALAGEQGKAYFKRKLPRLLRCDGCGSEKSIAQIKAENPKALSCCPERNMTPVE